MNTRKFKPVRAVCLMAAGAVLAVLGQAASASLLGTNITTTWLSPDLGTAFAGPETQTVGAGIEIPCPALYFVHPLCKKNSNHSLNSFATDALFDFGATTIAFSQASRDGSNNVQFGGTLEVFQFSNINWNGIGTDITGVALATNITGLDNTKVTWGVNDGTLGDWIRVDMTGLTLPGTTTNDRGNFLLTLSAQEQEEPGPEPSPSIPEPPGMALLGIGLAGVIMRRRRRRA